MPATWQALIEPLFVALQACAREAAQKEFEALKGQFITPVPAGDASELLNRKQTATLLGVTEQSVDAWAKRGWLRQHRLGGVVRYKKQEVLAALKEQTQPDGTRRYARRTRK